MRETERVFEKSFLATVFSKQWGNGIRQLPERQRDEARSKFRQLSERDQAILQAAHNVSGGIGHHPWQILGLSETRFYQYEAQLVRKLMEQLGSEI